MGRMKQLLPLDGKPIIRWCLDSLLSSGLDDIAVVLGPRNAAMDEAIAGLPVTVAFNNSPGSDMSESVRAGLRAITPSSSGVLIALSDHPMVMNETIRILARCHADVPDRIIIPLYKGRRGHPSLFPRSSLAEIFAGATLRDIIRREARNILPVEVPDEGVLTDIDTIEDYRKLCREQMKC